MSRFDAARLQLRDRNEGIAPPARPRPMVDVSRWRVQLRTSDVKSGRGKVIGQLSCESVAQDARGEGVRLRLPNILEDRPPPRRIISHPRPDSSTGPVAHRGRHRTRRAGGPVSGAARKPGATMRFHSRGRLACRLQGR